MKKQLFKYLSGGKNRRVRLCRWLLFFGAVFILAGSALRLFGIFSSIGPENGSFLFLGMLFVVMSLIGLATEKIRPKDPAEEERKKQ